MRWVGEERCGKILRIPTDRETMFVPGEYPCTMPRDHDKGKSATPHRCVIGWKEPLG